MRALNRRIFNTPTDRLVYSTHADIDELGSENIDEQEEERRRLHAERRRIMSEALDRGMRYPTDNPSQLAGDTAPIPTTGVLQLFPTGSGDLLRPPTPALTARQPVQDLILRELSWSVWLMSYLILIRCPDISHLET